MPGFKYDGRSRPTNDLYAKNFDEIFGKKKTSKTNSDKNTTFSDKNTTSRSHSKGVSMCLSRDCNNSLYKWTSPKDPRYCQDCL